MGVNRPASSVSAVLVHHNRWNREGRCVTNVRGDVWVAYGDAAYARQTNDYAVEATAESLSDILRSFVFARHHEDGYVRAVDIAPFLTMAEPKYSSLFALPLLTAQQRAAVSSNCASLKPPDYVALDQIGWPAEVTGTWDVWWFNDRVPREDGTINTRGIVVGYSIAGLLISLGHRRVATRTYAAIGAAEVRPQEGRKVFGETGYLLRVGMNYQGLIVYEIGVGTSFPITTENVPSTLRLIFGGNVELGGVYVRGQIGPALQMRGGRAEWGPFVTLGIGRVSSARVMPAY